MNDESEFKEYIDRLVNVSAELLKNFALKELWEKKPNKKFYDIVIMDNCFDKITLDAVTLFEPYKEPKIYKETNICRLIKFLKFDQPTICKLREILQDDKNTKQLEPLDLFQDFLESKNIKTAQDLLNYLTNKIGVSREKFTAIVKEAKNYRDKDIAHKDNLLKLNGSNYPQTSLLAKATYELMFIVHKGYYTGSYFASFEKCINFYKKNLKKLYH